MNIVIDKDRVQKRFGRSISSYNSEAVVQKSLAKELIQKLINMNCLPFQHVLEVGCGTGFLTDEFLKNFNPLDFTINDLSDLMQHEIEMITDAHRFTNWTFLAGDAEKIIFPGSYDLVISTSALQWFQDTRGFFDTISRSICKNGIFAFSTFGPENFIEIKTLQNTGLAYPSIDDLTSWLSPYFHILDCTIKTISLNFSSPLEVFRHIKLTGVNAIEDMHWNRRNLSEMMTKYNDSFRNDDGTISLTYHPIIIIAKKK